MKRMSSPTLLLLLCVVLAAAGCASKRDKAAKEAAASGNKTRTTADRMESFYPRVLGSFYRSDVTPLDETGEGASVSYNYLREAGEPLVVFSAFVYPAGEGNESIDDAVRSGTKDVKSQHRGTKELGTTPARTQQGGQTYEGRKVTFQYTDQFAGQGKKQPLISEMYVYRTDKNVVKYLVTYPVAAAGEAQQRLAAFQPAFPWPSGI